MMGEGELGIITWKGKRRGMGLLMITGGSVMISGGSVFDDFIMMTMGIWELDMILFLMLIFVFIIFIDVVYFYSSYLHGNLS